MGLSLVAQTITDVSISETESQSIQAFEAAEAGVEEALKQLAAGVTDQIAIANLGDFGAQVSVSFSDASGSLADRKISSGEATTFWLNSFQLDGKSFPSSISPYDKKKVKICWEGAEYIEAAAYYVDNGGDYKVKRYYLGNEGKKCDGFSNGAELSALPDNNETKFINVRFYGNSGDEVSVVMEGQDNKKLPQQGTKITSTATVNDVERKIEVVQGWPVPPMFFDFAVFSGGGLNK